MNFSAISLSMPSSAADSGVGLVVLSKALDSAEVAGEQLTEMMQEAAPGWVWKNSLMSVHRNR